MPNQLDRSTSPYLQQHADNPVDWREWSDAAFEEARARDVPVLLSIGYAACHWCHVMAHESFEDEATAAYMNDHFVNIKVDREERPDVDAVYMTATQAMTGQGGWPMTAVLTPDAEPFFCGTYFPDAPRHGSPSFRQVLEALVDAWSERRDEIQRIGAEVAAHLRTDRGAAGGGAPGAADLTAAVRTLGTTVDTEHAGFGGAPKFPPSMVLEFLLRHAARTGDGDAIAMVDATCEAMARGGIYDQLAGGFARYAVDAAWVVPHFEKMLYDNALLLRAYLHWWRQTGSATGARVAGETADFLLAEMRTPEGGFASALDADSEGVEGKFYVWTREQLTQVLGPDDGAWAAEVFSVTAAGTFEHGSSTLQRLSDPDDVGRLADVRRRLLAARAERVRPQRDDKVVAAWNGLTIAALAECGVLLDAPEYVDAARECGELLWRLHVTPDGSLGRVSRDGVAGRHAGVLEDYGCVAEGLLALLAATGDPVWWQRAELLVAQILEHFPDGRGGFYDTSDVAERLLQRPQDPTDNATPSGQSAAAGALLAYAAAAGSGHHRDAAEAALAVVTQIAGTAPRFAGWGLAVAEAVLAGPAEVAVVGPADDPARADLLRAALGSPAAGTVVAVGAPGATEVPLLRDRPLVDDAAAAYVCRGFVCERPVTDVRALTAALGG
ncbi:MAG TPA: thioredoxin domain-containing protein [Nocardioidaceae bacterium]|nr:thioredoxin domain-containing protein [Nocardioidaceae bacterium]